MILIGSYSGAVIIQITDDEGKVTGQVALGVDAAAIVTKKIMDAVKEIKAEAKKKK